MISIALYVQRAVSSAGWLPAAGQGWTNGCAGSLYEPAPRPARSARVRAEDALVEVLECTLPALPLEYVRLCDMFAQFRVVRWRHDEDVRPARATQPPLCHVVASRVLSARRWPRQGRGAPPPNVAMRVNFSATARVSAALPCTRVRCTASQRPARRYQAALCNITQTRSGHATLRLRCQLQAQCSLSATAIAALGAVPLAAEY